jgi:hypothetical protein
MACYYRTLLSHATAPTTSLLSRVLRLGLCVSALFLCEQAGKGCSMTRNQPFADSSQQASAHPRKQNLSKAARTGGEPCLKFPFEGRENWASRSLS